MVTSPNRTLRLLRAVGMPVVLVLTGLSGCASRSQPPAVPPAEPSAPIGATVELARGEPGPAGFYYSVRLAGFAPGTSISVTCRDSVSADGFKTFTLTIGSDGAAAADRHCYSGDGPEHWVTADGLTSNTVAWSTQEASRAAPPSTPDEGPTSEPMASSTASVLLAQGSPTTAGYWYDVTLTGYPADTAVEIVCRDTVDPHGFKVFSVRTDGAGAAHIAQACYSGDGPQHWVTADGTPSNKVAW